jgi:energy-converting hydrogenase Eha subunit A
MTDHRSVVWNVLWVIWWGAAVIALGVIVTLVIRYPLTKPQDITPTPVATLSIKEWSGMPAIIYTMTLAELCREYPSGVPVHDGLVIVCYALGKEE